MPKKTNEEKAARKSKSKKEKSPPPVAGDFKISRVLKVTKPLMKGDDVKSIQAVLISKGFHCGADGVNGVFGASTALAVRHFQSMNRLIVSGMVDRFTAAALGASREDDLN